MESIIEITGLSKNYPGGLKALKDINLEVKSGEIFALLGPNGAGKSTFIQIICGLTTRTQGLVKVGGYDILREYKKARQIIGWVPQEMIQGGFETVWNLLCFSRGIFGLKPDRTELTQLLKDLHIWDKRNSPFMNLSGGMKRRVMIAKALCHKPKVLFLDEPTAGVDVELRKEMWDLIGKLRSSGVTIILTTHYIEEAQYMAHRVGVINKGELILVENKETLMRKLGKKQMRIELLKPLNHKPESLSQYDLQIQGSCLLYNYNGQEKESHMPQLFEALKKENLLFKDITTYQSSLEDIFLELVQQP